MPDRVIRDELLESERWLSLKDNADRLAYLALLLRADSLGNFSAERFRLLRIWRDFGINTSSLVEKTLAELVDHDLILLYEAEGRPLLHIPRYRQRLRHLKRVFPPSPWTSNEEKQMLSINKTGDSQAQDRLASAEGKGREVIPSRKPTPDPLNAATWSAYETAYSARYGVPPVRNATTNSNVVQIVKRLGNEAPEVAAYYVAHSDAFYVKKRHPVGLLLKDCEGLRTQWKTGNKATALEARSAEARDNLREQYRRLSGEKP